VTGRRRIALLVAAPLLLAAKDPRGDVVSCASGAPVRGPDIVAVRGDARELRTVAVWRLTFARPVDVPSDLRIDVLVRDPRLPPVTRGDERGMNRIVRWDAIGDDATIAIIWLPHDGATSFDPPSVDGRTVTLIVPGRLLLGESANGVESVRRARWNIVVRAGGACDRFGGDVPSERLALGPKPSPSPLPSMSASASPTAPVAPADSSLSRLAVALLLFGLAALPFWLARRSRPASRRSSSRPPDTKPQGGDG
jgi:hypothetical protein